MVLMTRGRTTDRKTAGRRGQEICVGCHVAVLHGRQFASFGAGDEGVVLSLDPDAQNCEVIFHGKSQQFPVALRHLRVVASPREGSVNTNITTAATSEASCHGVAEDESISRIREDVSGCNWSALASLVRSPEEDSDSLPASHRSIVSHGQASSTTQVPQELVSPASRATATPQNGRCMSTPTCFQDKQSGLAAGCAVTSPVPSPVEPVATHHPKVIAWEPVQAPPVHTGATSISTSFADAVQNGLPASPMEPYQQGLSATQNGQGTGCVTQPCAGQSGPHVRVEPVAVCQQSQPVSPLCTPAPNTVVHASQSLPVPGPEVNPVTFGPLPSMPNHSSGNGACTSSSKPFQECMSFYSQGSGSNPRVRRSLSAQPPGGPCTGRVAASAIAPSGAYPQESSSVQATRLGALEARLASVEDDHRSEVVALRQALEECVRAIGTCARAIDTMCHHREEKPPGWSPVSREGHRSSRSTQDWEMAAAALHDAADLGMRALNEGGNRTNGGIARMSRASSCGALQNSRRNTRSYQGGSLVTPVSVEVVASTATQRREPSTVCEPVAAGHVSREPSCGPLDRRRYLDAKPSVPMVLMSNDPNGVTTSPTSGRNPPQPSRPLHGAPSGPWGQLPPHPAWCSAAVPAMPVAMPPQWAMK